MGSSPPPLGEDSPRWDQCTAKRELHVAFSCSVATHRPKHLSKRPLSLSRQFCANFCSRCVRFQYDIIIFQSCRVLHDINQSVNTCRSIRSVLHLPALLVRKSASMRKSCQKVPPTPEMPKYVVLGRAAVAPPKGYVVESKVQSAKKTKSHQKDIPSLPLFPTNLPRSCRDA
jgi:hypothetical protein